jgi:hypothetical protein
VRRALRFLEAELEVGYGESGGDAEVEGFLLDDALDALGVLCEEEVGDGRVQRRAMRSCVEVRELAGEVEDAVGAADG